MTITIPIEAVDGVMDAETPAELEVAIEALRRAHTVATAEASSTGEWADLDPSELPRF